MVGRNILEHPLARKIEWLTPTRRDLNLLDRIAVTQYIQKYQPSLIVHAAGIVGGIQANIREPVRFFIENLDIGRNLIMSAREHGVPRFLNLSCSCMYPRNAPLPLQEKSVLTGELEPTNEGYALARIAAQRLCEYISKEDPRFQYKTLVGCNLYGRYDEFDPRNSHLIAAIIMKLHKAKIEGLESVQIWGDGNSTREFMYTGDLADCVLQAIMSSDRFDQLPNVANVGTGEELSINEFYIRIAKQIGYKGSFYHDLSKPSGMARKVVDTSLLKEWGWTAPTPLSIGIEKAYQYYLGLEGDRSHELSASQ
jgi:GDP-L-fucose synthase